MDYKKIIPLETTPNIRASSGSEKGMVTIVYSSNGNRIEILEPLIKELQLEDYVQMGTIEHCLIIGKKVPNIKQNFLLKNVGKKKVIYSVRLVEEVISRLDLDFSQRVTVTLRGVELEEYSGNLIAKVWVKERDQSEG